MCRGDPACADVDHLLQRGSTEIFLPLFVHLSSHPLHLPLFPQQLQISCWDKLSKPRIPSFPPVLTPHLATSVSVEPQTFQKVISLGQQEVKGVPVLVEQLLTLELSREKEERPRWSGAEG